MKRYLLPLIAFILVGILAFLILKGQIFGKPKAGLKVESVPVATLFLDGKELGKTSFEGEGLDEGEKIVKLVPDDPTFSPWETKVKLTGGTLSYISRKFAETEAFSYTKIITMEKLADRKQVALNIISTPDSCLVKIDGEDKGFTPLPLEGLSEGEHGITLSSPGFEDIKIQANIKPGFRMNANLKLAQIGEVKEEGEKVTEESKNEIANKIEKEPIRPYVKIKDTPTGWLRVRREPSTAATEAAKVTPGQTFSLLDEESGWYKIEYKKGEEGWISGRYAEKYE